MAIKIIGAGFGRTGTKSLQLALEHLGYGPCYHGTAVFAHPDRLPLWHAALDGKAVDWATLLQGYGAIVDWPGCVLYQELLAAFPDAKVILTVRDPEQWYASAQQTIFQTRIDFSSDALAHQSGERAALALFERVIWQQTFGGRFADRAHALAVFQQHNAQVQQQIAPERLLVYNVAQGWAPLCQFLGAPLPLDQPFPHANELTAFLQMIAAVRQ